MNIYIYTYIYIYFNEAQPEDARWRDGSRNEAMERVLSTARQDNTGMAEL